MSVPVAVLWACLKVYSICMPVASYDSGHQCVINSGEEMVLMNDGSGALEAWHKQYPEFKRVPANHVSFECRRDT